MKADTLFPNEKYSRPHTRERLTELIGLYGIHPIIEITHLKHTTIYQYAHSGPRDITPEMLELIEFKLKASYQPI